MMERRRLHWKESSTIAAIRELGLERLEAVCSLWIVAALQVTHNVGINNPVI